MEDIRPRVGVGVFVFNLKNEFILGKRKGSHGAGTWALPGGHLEYGESFEECASREVLEETGLEVRKIRFLTATNDVMASEQKHYVTILVACQLTDEGKKPALLEPHKCECWEWVTWQDIQSWAGKREEVEGEEETGEKSDQKVQRFRQDKRQLFLPLQNILHQQPAFFPTPE